MNLKKTTRLAALLLALALALTACGQGTGSSGSGPASGGNSSTTDQAPGADLASGGGSDYYPVTVTTYNEQGQEVEQTFEACPERVVSISQANTELLLSLGLGDKIVATAHRTSAPWDQTAQEYESLNFLAQDAYPSKEVVLAQEPDLIIGWYSLFADEDLGPTQDWNDRGVATYLMKNTVSGLGKRNFDYLVEDIRNIGIIFNIQDRTDVVIQEIQERLAAVAAQTDGISMEERPTVVTVQMVKDNQWFARADTDLTANIIELAGGRCLDREYGYTSMEVLVDMDPDAILVIDRDTSPAEDTIQALLDNPSLQEVSAVKNQNFYVITHVSFYCGSMRTVEDIEGLAQVLSKA